MNGDAAVNRSVDDENSNLVKIRLFELLRILIGTAIKVRQMLAAQSSLEEVLVALEEGIDELCRLKKKPLFKKGNRSLV